MSYRNKEWLKRKLVDEKLPLSLVASECGVTKQTIKRWADKFGINRGTVLQRWLIGVGLGVKCPHCGEIVPNANYCCECGQKLVKSP